MGRMLEAYRSWDFSSQISGRLLSKEVKEGVAVVTARKLNSPNPRLRAKIPIPPTTRENQSTLTPQTKQRDSHSHKLHV